MRNRYVGFLIAGLWAPTLLAGVVFEIETKNHDQSDVIEALVDGGNLAMEIADSGRQDGTMIFRGDRREMVVVDHAERSYMVVDQATMQQVGGQVSQAMAQMEEALKNVPEDQRAMVEQMMKQRMPQMQSSPTQPQVDVRNTGDTDTINGYPCVRYQILRDGRLTREMWVTPWDNIEGGDEVRSAFEDMSGFMQEMLASLPSMTGAASMGDNPFAEMSKLGGFPVKTTEYSDHGQVDGVSVLRSATRRALDPNAFEPPAGYKRRSMMPGM